MNLVTYNAAISACEKGGRWQFALWLWQIAGGMGLQADSITCNATISACQRAQRWQEVLNLCQDMATGGFTQALALSCAIIVCNRRKPHHMQYLVDSLQQLINKALLKKRTSDALALLSNSQVFTQSRLHLFARAFRAIIPQALKGSKHRSKWSWQRVLWKRWPMSRFSP